MLRATNINFVICQPTIRGFIIACFLACCGGSVYGQANTLAGRSAVRDPRFTFRIPVDSWQEQKNRNVVMQQRDYSCGAAALATLMRFYWGHDVNENTVLMVVEEMLNAEELRDREKEGLTMQDLKDSAVKMGYLATVGELTFVELSKSKVPVIVVVKIDQINHFVVVRGISNECVYVADPFRGNTRMSGEFFRQAWQRNAILVVAPEGETQSTRSTLGVTMEERSRGYLNYQTILRQITRVPGVR